MSKKQTVAIIGRPNVGKSTLTNRLVGSRKSIVDDSPGITRDRIYFDVNWTNGKSFTLIDTGGIIPNDEDEIMQNIKAQVELALDEADKIIFLLDGKDGVTPVDFDIANLLRQTKKPLFLVVNKIDSSNSKDLINDFYQLGLGDPWGLSALHGCGTVGDLLDEITADIDENQEASDDDSIKLAIVGRPNVGKSSIINSVLNKKRLIVSDIALTTRDAINSKLNFEDTPFTIIDTAGIRKKAKVDLPVERFAVERSIKAIREADIAVLVIDATVGLTDQDKKISQIITEAGKGMILAVNKWDLIENKDSNSTSRFEKQLESEAPFLSFVPKIFISAKTKQRLDSIFKVSKEVFSNFERRISTSLLNQILTEAYSINPPSSIKGKKLKIFYATQVAAKPPTIVFFINDRKLLKDNYKRYLENQLRQSFDFMGTTLRLSFREKPSKKQ